MKWFYTLSVLGLVTLSISCSEGNATTSPNIYHAEVSAPLPAGVRGFTSLRIEQPSFSSDEVAHLSVTPLLDVELCRSAWKALKTQSPGNDPFQSLHSGRSLWSSSDEVDGLGSVHATPIAFSRLSGRWTESRRLPAIEIDCPFPTQWKITHPGLSVASDPMLQFVRGVSKDRPRLGIDQESYEATGGLVYRHRSLPLAPKSEDLFDLGWTMGERTLSPGEVELVRNAFGIPPSAGTAFSTDFSRIPLGELHPVKAISFSRTSGPEGGPGFWVMTENYFRDMAAPKTLFKRRAEPIQAWSEQLGSYSYGEISDAVLHFFDGNFGLNNNNFEVWDSAQSRLFTTGGDLHGTIASANLNHFLLPIYRETLQAGRSLWVWVVWSTDSTGPYTMTSVELKPDGVIGATASFDHFDLTVGGLPRDPLHY